MRPSIKTDVSLLNMRVLVITPTTGAIELSDAIESVATQIFDGDIEHLVVVDGAINLRAVDDQLSEKYPVTKMIIPNNVGAEGFYGHRIYAAVSHLIDASIDYVMFLDEDNWYRPDHVQTMVDKASTGDLDFSYALSTMHSADGVYLMDDNFSSLGDWESWDLLSSKSGREEDKYHVDTSCYCFSRKFIERTGYLWHSGFAADRRFFNAVRGDAKYSGTGRRTVCYRLAADKDYERVLEFSRQANQKMFLEYGGSYPWEHVE
jgi:glycosyltransferase involved in cell wall biosynthesis